VKYSESGDICLNVYLEFPEYDDVGEITGIGEADLFASGKSPGDNIDDLDKMHLAASSVNAAFYGNEKEVRARYAMVEKNKESAKLQSREYADYKAQNSTPLAAKTNTITTKPSIIEWLRKASKVTSDLNEQNKPEKCKQHENNVL